MKRRRGEIQSTIQSKTQKQGEKTQKQGEKRHAQSLPASRKLKKSKQQCSIEYNIIYKDLIMDRPKLIKQVKDIIKKHGNRFCRGGISTSYLVGESFDKMTALITAKVPTMTSTQKYQELKKGFAIVQDKGNYIYVDVICASPGYGGKILQNVEEFAKCHGKSHIMLSSLLGV